MCAASRALGVLGAVWKLRLRRAAKERDREHSLPRWRPVCRKSVKQRLKQKIKNCKGFCPLKPLQFQRVGDLWQARTADLLVVTQVLSQLS